MPIETRGRIIVVDDEVGTGYALKLLLELEMFEVLVAADGDEAYPLARSAPPDVLITDIVMPGLNGLDLIRSMKKDRRLSSVPVIVVSASEKENLDEALEIGARAALQKPIEINDLVSVIEEIIYGEAGVRSITSPFNDQTGHRRQVL
jgi:DNA-binding response OmpR family regulator